jgi:hypothetical protein
MFFSPTERYSFFRRTAALVVAAIVLLPAMAAAATHPLFNLQSNTQSPFPSDRFTLLDSQQTTGLRVNLPSPNCVTNPSDCADVALVNQLDGFNLQPRLSIPFDGAIDVNSVNSKTIFLVQLPNRFALGREFEGDDLGGFKPNIIGINQVVWDPASLTLFAESDQHLDQDSNYLLVITNGVHDAAGNPIQASREFQDDNGSGNTDVQTRTYLRALHKFLDNGTLHKIAPGLAHNDITAASLFTTETVTATLESIRDQIKAAAPPTTTFLLGTNGERTVFPVSSVAGITWNREVSTAPVFAPFTVPTVALFLAPGTPSPVGQLAFGKFNAANWETSGAFIPAVPTRTGTPAVQSHQDLFFNVFLPAGPRPTNGWPVAIFGHGFGDSKNNSPFAVAALLATRGIATIAINAVGHGFGADGTLVVTKTDSTAVKLPAGGRGVDQDGNGTIGSTDGLFAIGAQTDIATRDGLQETVADLMQVVRAVQGGVDVDGDGVFDLDANHIYYFGQSLGGIYGTIFLGIEPDVRAGVPNVPGGTLTDISRLSPAFRDLLGSFLLLRLPSLENLTPVVDSKGTLHFPFDDQSPLRNEPPITNHVPGAIAIQTFEDYGRWIAQAGDPVAWAPFIRKTPLNGHPKEVIIQFARGDQTVPNPTATALIRSGDLADRTTFYRNDLAGPLAFGNPHTFLTSLPSPIAIEAQTQIGVFFASDGQIVIDPDGPGPLFETPIVGALPEDLGFPNLFIDGVTLP